MVWFSSFRSAAPGHHLTANTPSKRVGAEISPLRLAGLLHGMTQERIFIANAQPLSGLRYRVPCRKQFRELANYTPFVIVFLPFSRATLDEQGRLE
jgi:hypothetical protein